MTATKSPRLKKSQAAIESKKLQRKMNEVERRGRKNNLSTAQIEAQTKARLDTQRAYHQDIEDLFKIQEEKAHELAAKFNKSVQTVLKDVQHRGRLTRRRGVNPYNAWNHFRTMDIAFSGKLFIFIVATPCLISPKEPDISEVEKNTLIDLQRLDEHEGYEKFQELPQKLYDLVIDELNLFRAQQLKGSRSTARARGQDMRQTTARITSEVCSAPFPRSPNHTDVTDSSKLSMSDVRRRRFTLLSALTCPMCTTRSITLVRRPQNSSRMS